MPSQGTGASSHGNMSTLFGNADIFCSHAAFIECGSNEDCESKYNLRTYCLNKYWIENDYGNHPRVLLIDAFSEFYQYYNNYDPDHSDYTDFYKSHCGKSIHVDTDYSGYIKQYIIEQLNANSSFFTEP